MGKRRTSGQRHVEPDDYFASGPFEFARFGKILIGKSHLTAEQLAEAQAEMAARYPVVVAEIDALVSSIAARIARLPPDRLLHRGWWEYAAVVTGVGGKKVSESDQLTAARMIDYVQSVIASVKPGTYAEDVSEDDWNELKTDVTTLFTRLTLDYQWYLSAHRKSQDPGLDMELEEFRYRAETLWLNIRGKRYQPHERQALLDTAAPHSDILVKLFGIDATTLVDELDKVLAKLTRGLADAIQGMAEFRDETLSQLEKLGSDHGELGLDALMERVFEDKDLAARREKVAGEVFGMDLFDVGKNTALPQALLDELSWSPGDDAEFFAAGEFRGWPLRVWPIMKRPFIRLNGRVFCFDIFSLFDNIYRVLRRIIIAREPVYDLAWNDRQKAVSEELPFIYLRRLLSGAQVYRPVYYRWALQGGQAQWYEADGLILFDDHLLVIEVKAGAFTYTSPANDLPAHLASLRSLLQAPARQGSRFVDYLESAAEVPIADSNHKEIGRLRRANFRHITVCTVTLDAFTALAARAQRLAPVGVDLGPRAVWPVSIDDLRVYAELFDNPLTFLHFIEQRMRAGQSQHVDLNDEMDHLGLYVAQNNYSQYAADLMAKKFDRLSFDGFRTPVDEYFNAVVRGDPPKLPRQPMPTRLAEIVGFLARSNEPRRTELASFLLDAAGDFRDQLATAIDRALRENTELCGARPLSIYGGMAMTLYVWSPSARRQNLAAIQHTQAVMMARGERSRRLVELEYTEHAVLAGAYLTHVSLDGLGKVELERITTASRVLQRMRLQNAQAQGKIGRNERCPCGSGKKFKQCHGRR
jgi:preprotein translocase subunit SecA